MISFLFFSIPANFLRVRAIWYCVLLSHRQIFFYPPTRVIKFILKVFKEGYGGQKKRGQIVVILPRRDTKVKKQASIDANISDILHGFRKSPMGGQMPEIFELDQARTSDNVVSIECHSTTFFCRGGQQWWYFAYAFLLN